MQYGDLAEKLQEIKVKLTNTGDIRVYEQLAKEYFALAHDIPVGNDNMTQLYHKFYMAIGNYKTRKEALGR